MWDAEPMSTLGSPVEGGHGAGDDAVLPGPVAVIAGGLSHERDVSLISDQILDGGKPVGVSAATEEVGAAARANSGGRRGAVGMVATISELGSCKVIV